MYITLTYIWHSVRKFSSMITHISRVFSHCPNDKKLRFHHNRKKHINVILLQTKMTQTICGWWCYILSKLRTDTVLGNYQIWIPTILESFLTVQMMKRGEFKPRIITKNWKWHSYKLEKPKPLVDNDFCYPNLLLIRC